MKPKETSNKPSEKENKPFEPKPTGEKSSTVPLKSSIEVWKNEIFKNFTKVRN